MRKLVVAMALTMALSATAYAQGGRGRGGRGGDDGAPKAGDKAPDFTAKFVGRKKMMKLSEIIKKGKKPVVLIFGSTT